MLWSRSRRCTARSSAARTIMWTSSTVLGASPWPWRPPVVARLFVEVVEVVGAKPSKWDVPDGRCDVVLDEPGVSVGRGGSNLAALVRQPGRTQEVIEPERSTSGGRGAGSVDPEAGRESLGFLPIDTGRVPAAPLPSGERVEAVVGDDVEAVLALDDVGHPEA